MFSGVGNFFRILLGLGLSLPLALRAYIEFVRFQTAKKIADILEKEKRK